MSEFSIRALRLGRSGKHPNADTLSIIQVGGRYPVIFKTDDFKEGDLVVHVRPDALVDTTRPEFAWLADKAKNDRFRVKFIKLRGVPSYGFFIPAPEGTVEGQDMQEALGIEKYEPGPCYQLGGAIAGDHFDLPQGAMIPQYDLEALKKWPNVLKDGEEVSVTEKIHGSNGRWTVINGELVSGSRTRFRRNSVWNRIAEKFNLREVLPEGVVIYGEVYGQGMQDLTYGSSEPTVAFFDVYDLKAGFFLNVDAFREFCDLRQLPMAPEVYRGPFDYDKMIELAEGESTIANHVREGVVVKPIADSWRVDCGRVAMKVVGEGYLLR